MNKYKRLRDNKISGYRRFKEQLKALNRGDIHRVRELGNAASYEIRLKQQNTLPLPFYRI